MDIKEDWLQCFINFLMKKTSGGAIRNEIRSNKELIEELHKPVIRKLKKKEKYAYLF